MTKTKLYPAASRPYNREVSTPPPPPPPPPRRSPAPRPTPASGPRGPPPPAPLPSLPPVAAWKFSYRTTFPVSAYWLYRQYSSWNNVSRAIWEASIDRSVAKVAGKIIFRVKQQPNGFCVSHIAQYIARWRMRKLRLTLSFIQHSRIGLQSTAYIHT